MAGLSGTVLAMIAGVLCYLASPRRQMLRTADRPGALLVSALICVLAAGVLWCSVAGWAAGLCATIGSLAAGLAVMPFVGAVGAFRALGVPRVAGTTDESRVISAANGRSPEPQ